MLTLYGLLLLAEFFLCLIFLALLNILKELKNIHDCFTGFRSEIFSYQENFREDYSNIINLLLEKDK